MHIMGSGKVDPAKLTPGAHVLTNGTLVYSAAEDAIKGKDSEGSGLCRPYKASEFPATGYAYSGRPMSSSPSPARKFGERTWTCVAREVGHAK